MDSGRVGEQDLRGNLDYPCDTRRTFLVISMGILRSTGLMAGGESVASLSDVLGNGQFGGPARACFEQWFKVRHALLLRILDLVIRVERRGIRSNVQSVRAVEVGGTQRDG